MNTTLIIRKIKIQCGLIVIPTLARVLSFFPKTFQILVLNSLSRSLRITAVGASGEYGEFIGNSNDRHTIANYLVSGTYSSEMVGSIQSIFSKAGDGTFVDVGANVGLVAIPIARHCTRCICFEADPQNFKYLSANRAMNQGLSQMDLHNLALYNEETTLKFELSETNSGDHRIQRSGKNHEEFYGESNRRTINVAAKKLDDILSVKEMPRPIVVKVDTQGAEVAIFQGGVHFLSSVDVLIFEYSPYLARRQGFAETDLATFVSNFFSEGRIMESEGDWENGFEPIDVVADKLRSFSKAYPHLRYLDVEVRRTN